MEIIISKSRISFLLILISISYSSAQPTFVPVPSPTFVPIPSPTIIPSMLPSSSPTPLPTTLPTSKPTSIPTIVPSSTPTLVPSLYPTGSPSLPPTPLPTILPTVSLAPTISSHPTSLPTIVPSPLPTLLPTPAPTITSHPTSLPTSQPSSLPTIKPSPLPTSLPTPIPTYLPTINPSSLPTPHPTTIPIPLPSLSPTSLPYPVPTYDPTHSPSLVPTDLPTHLPTPLPIPSPMPTRPKKEYKPDIWHRSFAVVDPLVLTGIVLGFAFIVYGVSKGKIYYQDFEARHTKSEFSSEVKHSDGGSGDQDGRSGRYSFEFGGRWNLGFKQANQNDIGDLEHGGDFEMSSLASDKEKSEGELFLESIGLGEFFVDFETNAIISVEDLCDSSLISNHDLVNVIGMDVEQVSLFRRAVNARMNQHGHLPVTSLHDGVTSSLAASKDMRQNLLGKAITPAMEQQLTTAERKRKAEASKFREYQKLERRKALEVITSRDQKKKEELMEKKKNHEIEKKTDHRNSALNSLLGDGGSGGGYVSKSNASSTSRNEQRDVNV